MSPASDRGRAGAWAALALATGAFALAFAGPVVARIGALHGEASGPAPYFVPQHGPLLYLAGPLAALSACVFYLLPGGLLVAAAGRARTFAGTVLLGFGVSLALDVAVVTAGGIAFGPGERPSMPFVAWPLATAVALGWLGLRARRGAVPSAAEPRATTRRRVAVTAVALAAAAAALVPKLYWESFNLDGIEAFEFGRSLERHVLPRWELHEGAFGFYPNFVLFAYPNHWFLELVGPVEAAARLPYLLWLGVVFAGVVALVETGRARGLGAREEAALWLALGAYTIVQAFDVNYEPFFCDLAETGATDTLQVASFLVAAWALASARRGWFWAFGLMTYAAAPGGLLLLGGLAVGQWLQGSPEARGRARLALGCALVCVAIGAAHDVASWGTGAAAESQFSAKNLIRRLYPPTLTELSRWNALVFPSGILPALSLLLVRRSDPVAFPLAITTGIAFGVLYAQAWAAVHQFSAVMVLPLVVFWRVWLDAPAGRRAWAFAAVVATTALSAWLSLPQHFGVNTAIREVGRATSFRVGDYDLGYERALRAGRAFYELFPEDYRLEYPSQPWGADPPSWIHYAFREKPPGTDVRYVVQPAADAAPAGSLEVARREGVAVYVLDETAWRRDRERDLPRVVTSALYEPILRETFRFFRGVAEEAARRSSGPGGGGSGILDGKRPDGGAN